MWLFRAPLSALNYFLRISINDILYNIALIGKWGTGKSSILGCVQDRLEQKDKENNEKKYLFANINAWKYEKVLWFLLFPEILAIYCIFRIISFRDA